MTEVKGRVVKSTQEQAVAAWVTHLNQIRLDELINSLDQQDVNLEEALGELAELKEFIGDPTHILGSQATKHGEIAEHVQVNFSNARRLINGLDREYTFEGVGRTAPEDYLLNGQQIQSKFYNGAKNTLGAIRKHIETYPDFVRNGGSYDIPKDQHDEIIKVLKLVETDPSQLSKADWKLVNAVRAFQKETGLNIIKDVHPTVTNYASVQQGKVNETIDEEETNIKKQDESQRKDAYEKSKPSLNEGLKVAATSAAIEGGVTFCMTIAKKRKNGKKLSEFTEEDWKDIGLESGLGTLKGGIRGGVIYTLTNFTATPANVASAYVTAVFGIAAQAKAYKNGEISKEDFVINSETMCLDVTVSAIASLTGQVIIPIPVLGAVIGNVAGEFVYSICKQRAGQQEMKAISDYKNGMDLINQQLDIKYFKFVLEIEKALKRFNDLEQLAFDIDVNKAFFGSIQLAREIGVNEEQILKTKTDIDLYFLT